MAALPHLITVDEYRRLPRGEGCAYELHNGKVVAVTFPKSRHWGLQVRLVRLLEPKLRKFGEVGMEFAFRPVAEFTLLAAEVAAVSRARFDAIDPEDNLRGAPDLVIEIKSPSNTMARFRERAAQCLANGTVQFWILDQGRKSVVVIHRDGRTILYGMADRIPLAPFGSGELAVSKIFE